MDNNLNEKIDLYRDISIQIIDMLKDEEYEDITKNLEKRQDILDRIDLKDKEVFLNIYKSESLIELDKEIKELILINIEKVKKDLLEYNLTKQVNKVYSNLSREKTNIFNKKV
ncbi:flagellar protein FliT [Clostridioides difficile]|nr:flagellar protein FliT [Clostridioides difficile]